AVLLVLFFALALILAVLSSK
ncbi:hypothetical protein, partial [Lactobacillus taiwanensis]